MARDAAAAEAVQRETGKTDASEIARATTLLFETQVTPFEVKVSQGVLDALPSEVSWQHFWSNTLFSLDKLPFSPDLSDVSGEHCPRSDTHSRRRSEKRCPRSNMRRHDTRRRDMRRIAQ